MVGEEQVSYYGLQSVSQLFGSLRMMCLNWLHHPRGGYFERGGKVAESVKTLIVPEEWVCWQCQM